MFYVQQNHLNGANIEKKTITQNINIQLELTKNIDSLVAELEKQALTLNEVIDERDKLKKQLNTYQEMVKSLKAEKNKPTSVTIARSSGSEYQSQQGNELNGNITQKVQLLNQEIMQNKETIQLMEMEKRQLEQKIQKLQQDEEEYKEQNHTQELTIRDLRQQVITMKKSYQKQIENLSQNHPDIHYLVQENNQLKITVKKLEDQLEKNINITKNKVQNVTKLEEHFETLSKLLDQKQEEIDELKEQLETKNISGYNSLQQSPNKNECIFQQPSSQNSSQVSPVINQNFSYPSFPNCPNLQNAGNPSYNGHTKLIQYISGGTAYGSFVNEITSSYRPSSLNRQRF